MEIIVESVMLAMQKNVIDSIKHVQSLRSYHIFSLLNKRTYKIITVAKSKQQLKTSGTYLHLFASYRWRQIEAL